MRAKIMHVDDDSDTRKAVRTLLKTEGYNVFSAMNAKICLNKLPEEKPDLILIDIMMPRTSGWDLYNKIRKRKINSKVVFLSVLPIAEKKIKEMHKRGISGYVMKPFTPEELIGTIKKVLIKPGERKNEKLSINSFISRINNKEKGQTLSEIITCLLVLQTIKNKKNIRCQEIIEQLLSELNVLTGSDLIKEFLSQNNFSFESKTEHKNLNNQIKKELVSRFNIFVGSNVLYPLLSKWQKKGIVKGGLVQRNKVYELTRKGDRGMKLLSDYFVKVLNEKDIMR